MSQVIAPHDVIFTAENMLSDSTSGPLGQTMSLPVSVNVEDIMVEDYIHKCTESISVRKSSK